MRTSEQIASMLKGYGVTHFFFVPVILPETIKAMAELDITPVMTHGEKAAAYMADGYARASGRVGLCGAQNIGSTNLAAGLRDAYMARSPVIAISGSADMAARYRNLYQDVEDSLAFTTVTKWNARVEDQSRFPDLVRQAFRAASSGTPRPVHLELASKHGANQESVEGTADAFVEARYGRAPSTRELADPDDVAAAAELLRSASRPVVIAGNGVLRSGAKEALLSFVRERSVPVVTSLNGMASIGADDPLCFRTVGDYGTNLANDVVSHADVVLVVGSSLGSMTTRNWSVLSNTARIVHIDVDPAEIGRNLTSAVPLVGDALAVLQQLAETEPFTTSAAWLDQLGQMRNEWAAKVDDVETSAAQPIRPERLLTMLSAEAAETAIIVGDTGHAAHWSARHLRLGAQHHMIRAAGSLGWALPAAIGAKCAAPDREVICFAGDGAFYYHMSELETARRYGIPVIIVVNNNVSLNQEAYIWDANNPRQHLNWTFYDADLTAIARAMGCHAVRVDDPADFSTALKGARESGLPSVIDVRTAIDAIAPKE